MRSIGSFLWFVALVLIALGYFVPDWIHLHNVVAEKDKQIAQFQQTAQQAEKEKQDALTALENANQNLRSCQQEAEQSNQTIARLTEENTYLKEQNRLLVSQQTSDTSSATPQPQTKTVQATAFGLVAFSALGLGSIVAIGLKNFQKHPKRAAKAGNYVYLTDAEIKELIQRRREAKKFNTPNS